jgi:hypothetical protein
MQRFDLLVNACLILDVAGAATSTIYNAKKEVHFLFWIKIGYRTKG